MSLGEATITIKKVKKVIAGGHHGGAWKVAYADFVTAMMAFFLLMWLINTISVEQKKGLADYFAPASISETTSGAGGLLGGTALGDDAKSAGTTSTIQVLAPDSPNPTEEGQSSQASLASASESELRDQLKHRQEQAFQSAAESIRQAMQKNPELAELSKQVLKMDITDEGLLIQLVDQQGSSMFDQGKSTPNARAQALLRSISGTITRLPNRVKITGHTNVGSSGKTEESDWVLSQQRANEARRLLQSSGVNADRFAVVAGAANGDPLYPDDPRLPGNRRIEILLLNERPALPPPGA